MTTTNETAIYENYLILKDEHDELKAINAELLEALETLTTLAEEIEFWPINTGKARRAIASAKGES